MPELNSFDTIRAHAKAQELANRTSNAYSFDYYGQHEWREITFQLLAEGYTEEAVETILRSKHMRWCADSGEATLRGFKLYFYTNKGGSTNMTGQDCIDAFLARDCKDLQIKVEK